MYKRKSYEELDFTDDFLFCKIMESHPELAKELLEMILQFKIRRVSVNRQVPIDQTYDGRGIRLDVYVEDEADTVYDIEMQTTKQKDLPKRTRYYQGMIDLNLIEKGSGFKELKKTYIIFICLSDPFSEGRYMYTFRNMCKEVPSLELGDETTKVFLNAAGKKGTVSPMMQDFFNLLNHKETNSDFSKQLKGAVENAKVHKEWRDEYMTLEMHYQEKYDLGLEEGREEIREESLKVFVQNIKMFVTDKAELCKIVRSNKVFEKYSDEEILKYY